MTGGRRRGVDANDPQVLEVLRLLWEIEHALRSRSKLMEAQIGITGPQRLVLRLVDREPELSPGDLARRVHLHPSTLTGVLRRLVDRGLLDRRPDPADHRRALLRVIGRAHALVASTTGTIESSVARALAGQPAVAVRHARHVLESLAAALGQISPHPAEEASPRAPSSPPPADLSKIAQAGGRTTIPQPGACRPKQKRGRTKKRPAGKRAVKRAVKRQIGPGRG